MKHLPFAVSLNYTEDIIGALESEFGLCPREVEVAKKLLDSNLPPLVRPTMIAYLFGVSPRLIVSMSSNPEHYYRRYRVRKKNGGYRQIEAPRRFIKVIQKWINVHILSKSELPPYVTGFVHDKNIFTNAKPHLPYKNLMVIDIEKFFPSVRQKVITNIFRNLGYPVTVSYHLARLCCYENRLPQGAPTSPALANIAFCEVDRRLSDLAKGWDCAYTRYADDIAFSGDLAFTKDNVREIGKILRQSGFTVNRKKSRIIGSGGRQMIAGIVVNHTGLPLRQKRKKWRAMFHQAESEPAKYVDCSQKLKGISAFVNMYDSQLAQKYCRIVELVEHSSK